MIKTFGKCTFSTFRIWSQNVFIVPGCDSLQLFVDPVFSCTDISRRKVSRGGFHVLDTFSEIFFQKFHFWGTMESYDARKYLQRAYRFLYKILTLIWIFETIYDLKDGIPEGRILGGVWILSHISRSKHYLDKPFGGKLLLSILQRRLEGFIDILF